MTSFAGFEITLKSLVEFLEQTSVLISQYLTNGSSSRFVQEIVTNLSFRNNKAEEFAMMNKKINEYINLFLPEVEMNDEIKRLEELAEYQTIMLEDICQVMTSNSTTSQTILNTLKSEVNHQTDTIQVLVEHMKGLSEDQKLILQSLVNRNVQGISLESIYRYEPYPIDIHDDEHILGRGAFAITLRVKSTQDQQLYAMKQVKISDLKNSNVSVEKLQHEVRMLTYLTHTHIIRYFVSFQSKDTKRFNMIMELADSGSLADQVKAKPSIQEILRWFEQCVSALHYMHNTAYIIHRDIKPENILLTSSSPGSVSRKVIKIADLGLACVTKSIVSKRSAVGTMTYASYEKAHGLYYDGKDDIWGLACIFVELVTEKTLEEWGGNLYEHTNQKVLTRRQTVLDACRTKLRSIADVEGNNTRLLHCITSALDPNVQNRASSSSLMSCLQQSSNIQAVSTVQHRSSSREKASVSTSSIPSSQATKGLQGNLSITSPTSVVSPPVKGVNSVVMTSADSSSAFQKESFSKETQVTNKANLLSGQVTLNNNNLNTGKLQDSKPKVLPARKLVKVDFSIDDETSEKVTSAIENNTTTSGDRSIGKSTEQFPFKPIIPSATPAKPSSVLQSSYKKSSNAHVEETKKKHMSMVVIGHVDAGKSTTMGHLIYKLGGIDARSVNRLETEAIYCGKPSFKYAWILDQLQAERDRGVTIDLTHWQLQTMKYVFTLIDTPGHYNFIRNMITGTSQADVGLLVIDSSLDGFENGWGSEGTTKEHILLAYTFGIQQMIIAVNKMDSCQYSQSRFEEIQEKVSTFLTKVGFKLYNVLFIPISGWTGENLIESTRYHHHLSWYQGPCLLDGMDTFFKLPTLPINKSLRLPVQDVYKIGGIGTVCVGRVETGILTPGMHIQFGPVGIVCEVKSVEMYYETLIEAKPFDQIGFHCKNVSVHEIHRGFVASNARENPAQCCQEFEAQLLLCLILVIYRMDILQFYTVMRVKFRLN
jgi:elongation factor 1-alpha